MNGDLEGFPPLTSVDIEQMISDQDLMAGTLQQYGHEGTLYNGPIQESSAAAMMMYNSNGIQPVPMDIVHNHHHPGPSVAPVLNQPRPQNEPWVEITEQPKQKGMRFRYLCEGRSAGSIPGENASNDRKTFPTIKIHNYRGQAIVVVSCVTKDPVPNCKPHPHSLVGKDCKKGVCTLKVKDASVISFPNLGIQCAKKKDVDDALKLRKEINVDPFQTGFDHASSNIDLNVVRLCFQVFLPDANGKVTRVVPPVVSHSILDKKAVYELTICRVDKSSGKARGGDEVFLLCEKVVKDDIKVRFFEEDDGELKWEAFGDFGQGDVHKQFAIVFKTPRYKEEYISRPVIVNMQLFRPSDKEGSDPIQFTYMPEDPDPDRIEEKRRRKGEWMNRVMPSSASSDGPSSSNSSVKESLRNKLTASRRIKQEPRMETDANGAASVKGVSMGSQASDSSIEALSSTSSASHNFGAPGCNSLGNAFTTNPSQPNVGTPASNDVSRVPQHFFNHLQQPLQQQQQLVAGGGQMSTSSAAGAGTNSQPQSLESLLSSVGGLSSLIDPSSIQLLLEQGIQFSSGDVGSSNMADVSVSRDMASVGGFQAEPIEAAQLQQQEDFLEVQAALESLNKT